MEFAAKKTDYEMIEKKPIRKETHNKIDEVKTIRSTKKHPMEISSAGSSMMKNRSIFSNYIKSNSPAIWNTLRVNNVPGVPSQHSDLHGLSMKVFRVSTSSGVEKLKDMYIEAYGQYIFAHRARGHPPSSYMDTLFSKIKKIKNDDPSSVTAHYYGVRIIKCNKYEDIVVITQEKADKLYDYLCRYGIQSQFVNSHELIKGLGSGKYAQVFWVRDQDGKEFAAKVYDTNKIIRGNMTQMIIYEIKI